jgi:hypothetical protein
MKIVRKVSEAKETLNKIDMGLGKIAPLVTKTLMEKFEKSGISPVFLVDNKITELKLIHEDEWSEAASELKKLNLSLNDFWFAGYDQTKYQQNSMPISLNTSILIISKKSGKSKEYKVCPGHWVVDFHKDLKNNFFQE